MQTINNAREQLGRGELSLGLLLRQARTGDIALIAAEMGFDWIIIDGEHNGMGLDVACVIIAAALGTPVTPFVRVNRKEDSLMTRYLDNGAMGVIVPHIDTAEDAQFVVDRCKFAPIGKRSIDRQNPAVGFSAMSIEDYCEFINRETLVVAMIESPVGIDNCDAIAAVDGMDALFIGAGDLSWEYGIPGQTDHELIVSAYEKVIAACQRHGKIAGMAGIRDRELVRRFMKMGARFILVNNDLRLLMAGGKASTSAVREFDAD